MSLKDRIEEALENLSAEDVKRFKRKLNEAELEPGSSAVPRGRLEKADPMDIADIIVSFYREEYGLRLTARILEAINQKPLADRLLEAAADGSGSGYSAPPRTNSEVEARAGPPPAEVHFVDRQREAIIDRTSLVPPILDALLGQDLLTQEHYDVITAKDTSQSKMRELFKAVNGWGRADKDKLYEALKASNGPLIRALGGQ